MQLGLIGLVLPVDAVALRETLVLGFLLFESAFALGFLFFLARLAVGATNGMRLAARSGETTGLLWEVDKAEVECELVGPTAGQESRAIRVPYDCVITGWTIAANASGSCVIDVWKDTLANFPPTVGDTITASAKPTLSAARTATSTTLTGWTTALSEGDWVVFKVDSASSITEVVIALHLRRA